MLFGKKFIELIHMIPLILLSLNFKYVDSCHVSRVCVCGHLTLDTKDILWMDDCVLIMTYGSLAMNSSKMIVGTRWDHPLLVFEEIDSKNEIR